MPGAAFAWISVGGKAAAMALLGTALGLAIILSVETSVRGLLAQTKEGEPPRRGLLLTRILLHWGLLIILIYATMAACSGEETPSKAEIAALAGGLMASMAGLVFAGLRETQKSR